MRIKVVSDLHLEFSDVNIKNDENCDVLILSGDIMIANDLYEHPETSYGMYSNVNLQDLGRRQLAALRFRDFLKRVSFQFPIVVYVAGNHEFYHGKWYSTLSILKDECSKFPNVHYLENDCVTIGDFIFVGGTLWTNLNKGDPLTLHAGKSMLNDFRMIRNDRAGYTAVKPYDTAVRHRDTLEYFKKTISQNQDKNFVVVSHHSPSFLSCPEKFKNDYVMNGLYHSDLSEFILDHPQIKLWTHGHTHNCFDYTIGSTRVICNPRGYEGYEPDTGWNSKMFIDI